MGVQTGSRLGRGGGVNRLFPNGLFDPLSLNPYIALDFGLATSRALKTGGTQATYLDLVPTWENPGSGSNATQGTSGSQPVFLAHTGRNYLHLPGITGNTITVPFGAGTYDYLITYVDNSTSSGSIASAAGIVTVGPAGVNFANKQIWKIRLSLTGTTVAEFLADSATHRAVAFVDSYAKTWTVNITGNNPAVIVGLPMLRFDGVDDFMSFTGATAVARVFAILTAPATSFLGGLVGSLGDFGVRRKVDNSGWRTFEEGGDVGDFAFTGQTRVNNILTGAHPPNARALVEFTGNAALMNQVGNYFSGDNQRFLAIDLEALYLLPASTSAADVASMRSYLNTRHGLGLTLP